MFVEYLTRGVKAGLVAGAVFGVLLALVANPIVGFADELGHEHGEHGHEDGSHGHEETTAAHDDAGLSVNRGVSVLSGVLWGVLLGAVGFGVAFYFLEPIVPGTGAVRSYVFAAAGFLTASGAPWLVLPPAPPGTAHALDVQTRMILYGVMMAAGAAAAIAGMVLYDRLRGDRGRAVAVAVGLLPVGALPVLAAAVPADRTTVALPSELAAGLVGLVVFGQALMWLVLATVHARLHGAEAGDTAAPTDSRSGHAVGGD
ncbi:CbtA family protein [Halobaculum magnesiiphilum]|uniref:CbtA family protein n=1 Tax=Halobaculum magnesiiphilum TaxID=1017351 RepID=A0A8T8WIA3_9EURY|nr:CbtA family protein [Halobaculum magnesiiphilum]QZP39595.1 CbtA family protein [Halobaculum magnesiiphilum]